MCVILTPCSYRMSVMKKPRSQSNIDPTRVVMSFTSNPVPVSFMNDVWETTLRPTVRRILEGDLEGIRGRREQMYREVEKLVKLQFSQNLTEKLEAEFKFFCSQLVSSDIPSLVQRFSGFSEALALIVKVFNALDRELIYRAASGKSDNGLANGVAALGFSAWRTWIVQSNLTDAIVNALLDMIETYRHVTLVGQSSRPDVSLISQLVGLLRKVELYSPAFEPRFFIATRTLYVQAADAFLLANNHSLTQFVEFSNRVFSFEESFTRNVNLLPSTWKTEDVEILRIEMVLHRLPPLIQRDLVALVRTNDTPTMHALFTLASLVNEKLIMESVLRFSFQDVVGAVCSEAVAVADSVAVIDRLVLVRKTMLAIVADAFGNRASYLAASKDAMEAVLNSASCAGIPALLAEWADEKISSMIDSNDAVWLDDLIGLFKLLAGKDLFEAHYRAFLAKRLISRFGSLDQHINVETAVVNLLKQECGGGYTGKLESMIRDVTVSHESVVAGGAGGVELKVCVATTGVWPSSIAPWAERPKLPQEIHDAEINFMRTYMEKNAKKSIKFVHAMTSAVIRFKRRDFVCSAAQAVVLSLFNEMDSVGRAVLPAETGIVEAELSKAVSALLDLGFLVDDNDILSVNPNFVVPAGKTVLNEYQFRRPAGAPSLTDEERAQTESSVMEDRQHQLDASIVRIMKRVKRAAPASLSAEIMEATKFSFSKQEISKRVASLVDREFLEKDAGDEGEIRYLA